MFRQRVFAAFSNYANWDAQALGFVGLIVIAEDESVREILRDFVFNHTSSDVCGWTNGVVKDALIVQSVEDDNLKEILDDNEFSCYYNGHEVMFVVIDDYPPLVATLFTFVEIEPK